MKFVHHDKMQVAEELRNLHGSADKQCFQGFGSYKDDAAGFFTRAALGGVRHVSVPAEDRNVHPPAESVQPPPLLVAKRLERADVHPPTPNRIAIAHTLKHRNK